MEHNLPRSFTIGTISLIAAATMLVVLGEKASAQDYSSFFSTYLSPTYTVPGYESLTIAPEQAPTPPTYNPPYYPPPYTPPPTYHPYPYDRPMYDIAIPYHPRRRRYRSPFGPLPGPICGDPWTTPGLGLAGDDIPLRVCVL